MKCLTVSTVLLSLLVVGFSGAPTFSQVVKGSIVGHVKDDGGAVVPDAKLALVRMDSRSVPIASSFSDEDGNFIFGDLEIGTYVLVVTSSGIDEVVRRNVSISHEAPVEIVIVIGEGCHDDIENYAATEWDRSEIVKLTFADAIVTKELVATKNKARSVFVSSTNIDSKWLSGRPNMNLKFKSQPELQERADHKGDFQYISFSEITFKGSCGTVTIAYTWAVGKNSRIIHLSGESYKYEYRKQSGKWIGKILYKEVS